MDPEKLDTATEAPEQVDIEAMTDEEFAKWDEQNPEEGDAPAPDTPDPEPEVEAPAEAEQEQPEPEQKAEEAEQPEVDIAALKAELDELKQQNKIVQEYQANPKEFLRKNPELRKQLAGAHEELLQQERLPPWATADPASVRLPNDTRFGKLAGKTPQELNELGYEDEAGQAFEYIKEQQMALRIRMEERTRLKQTIEQEQVIQRANKGWEDYAAKMAEKHPDWTDQQKSEHVIEVANYMASNVTPGDIARLMNIDTELKEAREAGFEEGRKSVIADMEKSGSAPSSAGGQGSGTTQGTLLDKFKGMSPAQRAEFIDSLTDEELMDLENQATKNRVDLDSL